MKVVAIIQARMGSERLPGKVLRHIGGYPALKWVVEAARNADFVDQVVVATSDRAEDSAIVDWCSASATQSFRGPSDDVLGRIRQCAQRYRADVVLRLTADCPMLDVATVSELLARGLKSGKDYFTLGRGFPDGLDCEGITYRALVVSDRLASLPSEREHVTPFIKANPSSFSQDYYSLWQGLDHLRLTLDEVADLELLNKLVELASIRPGHVDARHLVDILQKRPDLRRINGHITRNEGYQRSLDKDRR